MTQTTYTIKQGDTLLAIAIEKNIAYSTLLSLNPKYLKNPDLIPVDGTLILPSSPEKALEYDFTSPVTDLVCSPDGGIDAPPACKGIEVAGVMFITGEPMKDYKLLTPTTNKAVLDEIEAVKKMMDAARLIRDECPTAEEATDEELETHNEKKQTGYRPIVNKD